MRKVSPGLVCIVLGVVLLLAAGGLYARLWANYQQATQWKIEGGGAHAA